jgi:hypothetical protein
MQAKRVGNFNAISDCCERWEEEKLRKEGTKIVRPGQIVSFSR